MNPIEINYKLKLEGSSQTAVAESKNVDRSTVNKVIKGETTSLSIATEISAITKISISKLFPDGRYDQAA